MQTFENWQVLTRLVGVVLKMTPAQNSLNIADIRKRNPFSPRQELMGESMLSLMLNNPETVKSLLKGRDFSQDRSIIDQFYYYTKNNTI